MKSIARCTAALATVMGMVAGTSAWSQELVSSASTREIVRMLKGSGNASKFSYKPTPAPDAATHACPGADAPSAAGAPGRSSKLSVEAPAYVDDQSTPAKIDLNINFASGSDRFDGASSELLARVAEALNDPQLEGTTLAVAGHTDEDQTNTEANRRRNMELSCARAIAVRNQLIRHGVAPQRLGAYGFGWLRPLEKGVTKSALNRRVEIRRAS